MAGRLALAGLVPDRTPLDEWVAAAFAVLVSSPVGGKDLDKALTALEAPLPTDQRTDIDRDTWGLTDAAVAAQERLLAGAGIELAAHLDNDAADEGSADGDAAADDPGQG